MFSTLNVVVFQSCLLSCLCVSGFVVDHHPTAIYIITITTFTTATTYTAAAAVMKFVSIVATLAAVTVPTTSFSVTPSGVGNRLRLRPAVVATSSALAVAADLGEIRKRTREVRGRRDCGCERCGIPPPPLTPLFLSVLILLSTLSPGTSGSRFQGIAGTLCGS